MKQITQLLLGLLVLSISHMYGMNSLTYQASTAASKIEVATQENLTLESLVNLLATDLLATQTTIFAANAALVASTATIESLVQLLISNVDLTQKDISYLDTQFVTIETALDITSTQLIYAYSTIAVLESMVSSYTEVTTIITSTNQFAALSALDSIAEKVASDGQTLSNQWSTINSFIDQDNRIMGTLTVSYSSVDSTLSKIDAQISSAIATFNRTINSTAGSSNSVLDVIIPLALSTESMIANIQMDISTISSSLGSITSNINTAQNLAVQAFVDFQETWTILNSLQNVSLRTAESFVSTMLATAKRIQFTTDQSATLTSIAAINSLVVLMDSQVNTLIQRMNNINVLSYDYTFTALNKVLTGMSSLDSLIDSLASTGTVLTVIQSYLGIPIHQSDVGTAGYTIVASGNYYLAEDILFAPPFTANAITFGTDNISLDLSGKFIMQTNAVANVRAFNTDGGLRDDIVIFNGSINNFVTSGIFGVYSNLQLSGLNFENCSGDAIRLTSNSSDIILRNVNVIGQKGTSAFTAEVSRRIVMDSCNFLEATSTNGVIFTGNSSEVIIRNCKVVNMNSNGISLNLSGGQTPRRFVLEGCTINSNNGSGINMGTSQSCVIKNCTIKNNTTGITSSGSVNTFINNIIANNTTGMNISDNNSVIMGNTFMNNTTANINSSSGLQSYLGNFAFNPTTESNNYSGFLLPKIILNASKIFPSPTPTYWENVSMTQ